jgi:transcriptional regulator with XRE-family HTH domain
MGKKKKLRQTHIRDWRKFRGFTLERLAQRIGMTTSNLSKIERGTQAYTQPVLEALADALTCSPADLIMRPPGAKNELQALIESLDGEAQGRAIAVIKALKGAA